MKKPGKYGIALFGSVCLLAIIFPWCSNGVCAAVFANDKVKGLIAQLQGRCCLYQANRGETDPSLICQKLSDPWIFIAASHHDCASWAAQCLGAMGKDAREAVPALIQALETGPNNYDTGDGPIPTRDDIMRALGSTGDPRAVKPLIAALYSPRPVDAGTNAQASRKPVGRDAAIEALGLLGPVAQEAVPNIIPFLKKSRSSYFRTTTKALGQIRDPRAIPALIEALDDPTDAALAADALGEFGAQAKPAVPILIEMIEKSPNMNGDLLVIGAIQKISGNQDYFPVYTQKEGEA